MSECVVRMDIDEMPAACGPCKLSCTAICKEWTKVDRKEIGRTKSPNCPILAVLPEGHGRLGDLDELGRKINGARIRAMQDGQDTNPYWECGDIIASEQTIVPAERSET